MSARLPGDARAEWRAHWPVVLAACAGVAVSTINTYSLGVFTQPLQQDTHWSRAAIYSGHSIAGVVTVLSAPFMGAAVDRLGPRRIGLIGVSVMCTITALLGTAGPSLSSWLVLWIGLALINMFILPNVWTAAVSSLFTAGRGLALAVTLCGSGIGSIVTPYLAFQLIGHLGWRLAYVALAGLWAGLVLPLTFAFFHGARDRERRMGQVAAPLPLAGIAVRKALLSLRFLRLGLATLLIASVVVPIAVTLVPILSDRGLTRASAAQIASLLGFSSIFGRLTIGYLLDHLDAKVLAAMAVSLPVVACALLIAAPGSTLIATVAVLTLGLSLGAELDLVAYLASRYFSLRNFGLVFGTLAGIVTLGGTGIGPMALSLVFDHLGSYVPALWTAMPLCAASALLFLTLGPYPREP